MDNSVVKLVNINKIYQQGTETANQVLFDINLQLQAGDFCALVGPSGSGKSSLLNIIGLLDAPSSGEIWLNGLAAGQLNDDQLSQLRGDNIGFIFQFHHLLPAFSVLENVLMPEMIKTGSASSAHQQYARQLLQQVGLAAKEDKLPSQISGGQQQRVAIARALLLKPKLLLADEPTGNLDSHSANEVFNLLKSLNKQQQSACLMVTHASGLAQKCDKIYTVVDGKLQL